MLNWQKISEVPTPKKDTFLAGYYDDDDWVFDAVWFEPSIGKHCTDVNFKTGDLDPKNLDYVEALPDVFTHWSYVAGPQKNEANPAPGGED